MAERNEGGRRVIRPMVARYDRPENPAGMGASFRLSVARFLNESAPAKSRRLG